jgi:hypothetical protein
MTLKLSSANGVRLDVEPFDDADELVAGRD